MANSNRLVCIGAITSAHGIRGEVKVCSFTDPATALFQYKNISFENGEIISFKSSKAQKNQFICKLKDLNDRNQAEKLAGNKLYIPRDSLPCDIDEEEYYIDDLQGLLVMEQGQQVGIVSEVFNFGAGDIIEITFADKNKELHPFTKEIFPALDLKENTIVFKKPEIIKQQDSSNHSNLG